MKKLTSILVTGLLAAMTLALTACGDDDDDPGAYDIYGTWIGEHRYENNHATKSNFLYITFDEDGTGQLTFEGQVRHVEAYFSYRVSGGKIYCAGASASAGDDGIEADEDFSMTLSIDGDRLIPQDQYTGFILTRNGSVITGDNGNIIHDGSNPPEQGDGYSEENDAILTDLAYYDVWKNFDGDRKRYYRFYSDGEVDYTNISQDAGSDGVDGVRAIGKLKWTGRYKARVEFTKVFIYPEDAPDNHVAGWQRGKTCVKQIKITPNTSTSYYINLEGEGTYLFSRR